MHIVESCVAVFSAPGSVSPPCRDNSESWLVSTVIFVYLIAHRLFHSRGFLPGFTVENKNSSYSVHITTCYLFASVPELLVPSLPVFYLLGSGLMVWVGHRSLPRNLYVYSCLGSLFVTHRSNDETHHLLLGELSALHLPGNSYGQSSLVGCSPWGCEESDTERLHFHFSLSCIGEGNGNPLQHSCLENPRDGGACWAAIYGVSQSQT